jgi:hypothetical protein
VDGTLAGACWVSPTESLWASSGWWARLLGACALWSICCTVSGSTAPATYWGSSIIEYGLLFYLASLMNDCDPSSFCYKHAQTFLSWQVRHCTCLRTRPLGLSGGYRIRMFLSQPHNTAARKQVQEQ